MPKIVWSPEMNRELKARWEAGMPHAELSKLYPGYTWRTLANQASRIGAKRPMRDDTARIRVLALLKESPNQSVVTLSRELPFSSDNIRYALRALHAANQIRIVDYNKHGIVYAYGGGDDLTREQWRAARDHVKKAPKPDKDRVRKMAVSFNEARIIHTKAVAGMCTVPPHYLQVALFGAP